MLVTGHDLFFVVEIKQMANTLVVVCGDKHNVDPTYRCVSGNSEPGKFALLEVSDDGEVRRKMHLPRNAKNEVENLMNKYRSVYVKDQEIYCVYQIMPSPQML